MADAKLFHYLPIKMIMPVTFASFRSRKKSVLQAADLKCHCRINNFTYQFVGGCHDSYIFLTYTKRMLCSTGDTWTETLAYVLFWGSASFGTLAIILYNGKDFVDAPKLVQKEKMD